jgi:hypothetical protein
MRSFVLVLCMLILPIGRTYGRQLSGSFTVGGSSPSFATLQDAADAVAAQGVSGPVFFNIRPGTYTRNGGATTVLDISAIPGVSPTNRVTFQADAASGGNADNVILQADFNSSSSSTTLTFVRSGFITLHNLTFKDADSLDMPAGFLVRSDFAPDGIVVDGCTFIGTPYMGTGQEGFGTDYGIVMQFSSHAVTVTNNRFYRMLRAVSMDNGTDFIVDDNQFFQWYSNQTGSGNPLGSCILLTNCVHASVRRNTLDGTGGNGGSVGISVLASSTSVVERNFIGNRVRWQGGSFADVFEGIKVVNTGTGADSIVVVNNLVFASAGSDLVGIDIFGPNNKVLFNTVSMSGSHSDAVRVNGENCTVINNIMLGGLPTTYNGGNGAQSLGLISNYNVIIPPNIIMKGVTYSDFAGYQFASGLDSNSDSKSIFFSTDSLGHITFDKCQSNDLALIGIPIPGITTDYYDAPRDSVQPFRGAVEGTRTHYNTLFEGFRAGLTGAPFSLAAADFLDNDGDDDIAVPDWDNRRVMLFRNLQPGRTFVNSGTVFTSVRPMVVKFFDFDGDGHLDLIVGGDTSAVEVFWGDGSGGFTAPTLGITDDRVRSIEPAPGFINGRPTLLITEDNGFLPNTSFMEYLVFEGRDFLCPEVVRSGPVPEPDTVFAPMVDLAYGDFGGDATKEIVATTLSAQARLVLFKNLGKFPDPLPLCDSIFITGTLDMPVFGPFNLSSASSIAMGDFDGDGDNDLVTTCFTEDSLVFIRNQGNFTFSTEFIPATQAHGVVAFDYDNDGDLDIVTMNRILEQNGITIYLNDGTGHFTEKSNCFFPFATGIPTGIIAADFDHDGRTDVAITTIQDSLFVIYNLGLNITGVKESPRQQVSTMFILSQNYPNPFNPVTTIEFNVPVQSDVRLKVYNMLGQEVATLIDGIRLAGRYSIPFDASRLASGVYVYRLSAGKFSEVKKMLLIR